MTAPQPRWSRATPAHVDSARTILKGLVGTEALGNISDYDIDRLPSDDLLDLAQVIVTRGGGGVKLRENLDQARTPKKETPPAKSD